MSTKPEDLENWKAPHLAKSKNCFANSDMSCSAPGKFGIRVADLTVERDSMR